MAAQRRGPTVSPRKMTEKTEIASGEMKKMATAEAKGMAASPRKKQKFAKTTQHPRRRCRPSRRVLSIVSEPPVRGTSTAKMKAMPNTVRKKMSW